MKIVLQTASEQVYEELRRRIVHHELSPGTPLPLAELADELGVSTMPVRAALSKLQADGLIRQVRHRGASVAPLEIEDLELIQAVRTGIEGLAAEIGARSMTTSEVAQMNELFNKCKVIASQGDLDTYLASLWELHDVCYWASRRPRLLELIHQYRRRAERYIRLAVGSYELPANLVLQQQFVDACTARDGVAARNAICHALIWTVETLEGHILENSNWKGFAESPLASARNFDSKEGDS